MLTPNSKKVRGRNFFKRVEMRSIYDWVIRLLLFFQRKKSRAFLVFFLGHTFSKRGGAEVIHARKLDDWQNCQFPGRCDKRWNSRGRDDVSMKKQQLCSSLREDREEVCRTRTKNLYARTYAKWDPIQKKTLWMIPIKKRYVSFSKGY